MVTRRRFVKALSAAGSISLLDPFQVFPNPFGNQQGYGIHPFIENNPEAVFIMKTQVDYLKPVNYS